MQLGAKDRSTGQKMAASALMASSTRLQNWSSRRRQTPQHGEAQGEDLPAQSRARRIEERCPKPGSFTLWVRRARRPCHRRVARAGLARAGGDETASAGVTTRRDHPPGSAARPDARRGMRGPACRGTDGAATGPHEVTALWGWPQSPHVLCTEIGASIYAKPTRTKAKQSCYAKVGDWVFSKRPRFESLLGRNDRERAKNRGLSTVSDFSEFG